MSCKGGETIVEIAFPQGKELGKGISICSENDSYKKKIGIKKATALALQNIKENKNPKSFESVLQKNNDIYASFREAMLPKN